MTVRRQARSAERRLLERRPSVASAQDQSDDRAPRLGELLVEARERKGVDLSRAERDTKIRAKYLDALERSDFSRLPGAVYTKGFLRNYAIYLGLDPETILASWKAEVGSTRLDAPAVIPPRPLEAPRGGLTFTPGIVIAALLTVGVLLFAGYVAYQLMRFTQPPSLAVTSPQDVVSLIDAEQTTLRGTSDPGALVTIETPGGATLRVTADSTGHWSQIVQLAKGANTFTILATDPATAKDSAPRNLVVQVPLPTPGPEAPTLTVTSPNDGTAFQNGAIPIQGTTNGTSVTVTAAWLGPITASGTSPTPQGTPAPSTSPVAVPPAKQIKVDEGAFSDSYQLAPGRWTLTVTASGAFDKTTTEQRAVTVAFTGVDLVVAIRNSPAWIKVWVDGQVAHGYDSGQTVQPGHTLEFTGKSSVEVRTGSAGATYFTLNGASLGPLGASGVPETWLFRQPPAEPARTGRT